jgi:hypothetical protein
VKDLYNENWKKMKPPEDGEASYVHRLILWKLLYYWKQSTDSMQCSPTFQCHSSQK